MISHQQVEHVARAFYETQGDHASWDMVSESVKECFRIYARQAISFLEDAKASQTA